VSEQGVLSELRFLIEAHGVERILLLAHQNCAFYASRLNMEGEKMEHQQKLDLAKAARLIYRATGIPRIEGYFSRVVDQTVVFESVDFDPTATSRLGSKL
jgi:lipopolysaccharide biosynthesis protein